jgi:hypothetical protein
MSANENSKAKRLVTPFYEAWGDDEIDFLKAAMIQMTQRRVEKLGSDMGLRSCGLGIILANED